MSDVEPHRCYFEMVDGGMACACGETVKADPEAGRLMDLPSMFRAFDLAMQHESIPAPTRERIINRLLYGDPSGPRARHQVPEQRTFAVTTTSGAPLTASEADRRASDMHRQHQAIIMASRAAVTSVSGRGSMT